VRFQKTENWSIVIVTVVKIEGNDHQFLISYDNLKVVNVCWRRPEEKVHIIQCTVMNMKEVGFMGLIGLTIVSDGIPVDQCSINKDRLDIRCYWRHDP